MSDTRKSTKRRIEEILKDYPNMAKYIDQRRQELMYPVREEDDNVGGGKSSKISRPQETLTIIVDEDKRLKALENEKEAVEDCFNNSDYDTQVIINELYFKKRPQYTIDGLVTQHLVMCARTPAFQKKSEFFSELSKKIGLYDPY